jgi:fatty acid/phospholipid biosynthesis enzyme
LIRIAVDAMGGDRAPEEVVAGALEAVSPGIQPILFGRRPRHGWPELVETTQVIDGR